MLTQFLTTRLYCFLTALLLLLALESVCPFKKRQYAKRGLTNLLLAVGGIALQRLFIVISGVEAARVAAHYSLGLFNQLSLTKPLAIIAALLILDVVIYAQHVLMHKLPVLWRLHQVHHADNHLDVTTGVRFHPLESLLSMGIRSVTIVLFGLPVVAVLIFEIVLNATSMFNHSNLKLNSFLDKYLRKLIVTPDMHRVHHTVDAYDQHHNFAFNLSLWDKLFKTYRERSAEQRIGLKTASKATDKLLSMLMLPFKRTVDD